MAPPQRVSSVQIRASLEVWRGDVTNTSRDLGVTKKAIYDRIHREGIDLAFYRQQPATEDEMAQVTRGRIEEALQARDGNAMAVAEDLNISRRWLYRCMESFGIEPANYRNAQPAPPSRPRPVQTPRVKPEQTAQIQTFRLRLQSHTGRETTNTDVLEQFLRDCFPAWADAMLTAYASQQRDETA